MAMIKCIECGNEVSTTADSCPHCGAKMKKKEANNKILDLLCFFSLAFSLFLGFSPWWAGAYLVILGWLIVYQTIYSKRSKDPEYNVRSVKKTRNACIYAFIVVSLIITASQGF